MTEQEKMVSGRSYDPSDAQLVRARLRAKRLCAQVNSMFENEAGRRALLCDLFGKGGDTVGLTSPFHCDYGINIELDEKVFFNFSCIVLDVCKVSIGSFTLFGPAVQIYTALHPMHAQRRRALEHGKPVTIGSDVWVGGAALILPGVTIGDRSVIGAASVVRTDVPCDVFAAGNPCRVIRAITAADRMRQP